MQTEICVKCGGFGSLIVIEKPLAFLDCRDQFDICRHCDGKGQVVTDEERGRIEQAEDYRRTRV